MRLAFVAVFVAGPAFAVERPPAVPRAELTRLEQALSRAADSAAQPHVFALTGAECRGYRIDGLGAVFVLPPRALRSRTVVWRTPVGPSGMAPRDRQIRVIELQAQELQREAARTHAEVERAIAEVQREVAKRRSASARPVGASTPPPAEAPAPPAAPEASPATPPEEPDAPLPPAPPWIRWLEAELPQEQEAPADAVIARTRAALVEALVDHGGELRSLGAEETIAAAIDFVPNFAFGPGRPEKTLVLRVRKKDLDERRAGRIGPEQLRARIEVVEY